MFIINLLRFLFGYVVFSGTGESPEKFMNFIAKEKINIWGVKFSSGYLQGCVLRSEYKYLRPIAYKSRMRIRIKEKKGLIFILRRYKIRLGIAVGSVVFILIINILSLFIWRIDINGNVNLTEEQVLESMREIGIHIGAKVSSIDPNIMEQKMISKLEDVSWIAINVNGSVVSVEIHERETPPEIINVEMPSNLVASDSGQVTRLEVYGGKAVVKENDVVLKGQLLVSGIFEDDMGASKIKRSYGKVFARVRKELTEEIELSKEIETSSEDFVVRSAINFMGLKIPIILNNIPEEECRVEINEKNSTLFGNKLPISLYEEKWIPVKKEIVSINFEEALNITRERLLKKEEESFGDESKIISKEEKVYENEGKYFLTVNYLLEENIALENIINITQ